MAANRRSERLTSLRRMLMETGQSSQAISFGGPGQQIEFGVVAVDLGLRECPSWLLIDDIELLVQMARELRPELAVVPSRRRNCGLVRLDFERPPASGDFFERRASGRR